MQLGMIGLGRMGANLVRRLMRNGHECVVHDLDPASVRELEREGASLYDRFASRGEAQYADQLLSAMRAQFGGHAEKVAA
jgi:6-phosphogluconate dehydrogenase (decarboxylating)